MKQFYANRNLLIRTALLSNTHISKFGIGIFSTVCLIFMIAKPVSAAPATDCTIFVSPNGNGNGNILSTPTTLSNARNLVVPGSIVCLTSGIHWVDATPFIINKNGIPSSWITFKSFDSSNRAIIRSRVGPYDVFQIHNGSYIEVRDLEIDGRDANGNLVASNGIACKGPSHHVRAINNYVHDVKSGGIVSYVDTIKSGTTVTRVDKCDYMTIIGNKLHHGGNYTTDGKSGWSSGISLNNSHYDGNWSAWYDSAPGFHSVVINNIISGWVDGRTDENSDGNGIIVDLGGNSEDNRAGTPPVLIANNVVYMNGGRCIHTLKAGNSWIVNNTCYKNSLDSRVTGGTSGNNGEFIFYGASRNVLINNIAVGWEDGRVFSDEGGVADDRVTRPYPGFEIGQYYSNLWSSVGTGDTRFVESPTIRADPTKLKNADPQFVNPLEVRANGDYANALNPNQITNHFYLKSTSPALSAGIDPTTVTTDNAIKIGLQEYVFKDIEGKIRQDGRWDLGAYQASVIQPPNTSPTPTYLRSDFGGNPDSSKDGRITIQDLNILYSEFYRTDIQTLKSNIATIGQSATIVDIQDYNLFIIDFRAYLGTL